MPICCMCHEDKPEDAFAFRSLATGERQGHCRECHAAYRRQHYLDNKPIYIAREVARINGYRLENRLRLFEYLSTHACVDCGETDVLVLEFDHREPASKRREVTYIAARKPWKFVEAEIVKCDVRCANCHRRRTARQQNWAKASSEARIAPPLPPARLPTPPPVASGEVRTCTRCGRTQPLENFSVKDKVTGRRAWRCRACVAENSRDHYQRNQLVYLARAKQNKRAYRHRTRSLVLEFMKGQHCIDCGESDPIVLEFDHRDGVEKEDNVARLMATGSWSTIADEIAKCEIRCTNCHRRRTAEQFGWLKRSLQMAAAKMKVTRE